MHPAPSPPCTIRTGLFSTRLPPRSTSPSTPVPRPLLPSLPQPAPPAVPRSVPGASATGPPRAAHPQSPISNPTSLAFSPWLFASWHSSIVNRQSPIPNLQSPIRRLPPRRNLRPSAAICGPSAVTPSRFSVPHPQFSIPGSPLPPLDCLYDSAPLVSLCGLRALCFENTPTLPLGSGSK